MTFIRERQRSIERREETLGAFGRMFERGHYDPDAGRRFWHETHRRGDDPGGDGRVA
jgi:hypothetical protein